MRLETRLTAIGVGLLMAGAFAGCSVHGTVGREDLLATPTTTRFDDFARRPGQMVKAYTTTGGVAHELSARAWIEGDSMVFERRRVRHRVALAEIASVEATESDAWTTAENTVGVLVTFAVLFGLAFGIAGAIY
jgi:hypothetical protein